MTGSDDLQPISTGHGSDTRNFASDRVAYTTCAVAGAIVLPLIRVGVDVISALVFPKSQGSSKGVQQDLALLVHTPSGLTVILLVLLSIGAFMLSVGIFRIRDYTRPWAMTWAALGYSIIPVIVLAWAGVVVTDNTFMHPLTTESATSAALVAELVDVSVTGLVGALAWRHVATKFTRLPGAREKSVTTTV